MRIDDIQGSGAVSPLVGQTVTTSGVVTASDSNGCYLPDPTGGGDVATSDAVFVLTGAVPAVAVGPRVEATGPVCEFTPSGAAPVASRRRSSPRPPRARCRSRRGRRSDRRHGHLRAGRHRHPLRPHGLAA